MNEIKTFLMLPKELFTPDYKGLSVSAKVLYAFLLERNNISIKNKWLDDEGMTYIIFTVESLSQLLNLSLSTIGKLLKELEEMSLIKRKRQGLGRPDRIRVKILTRSEEPKTLIGNYDMKELEKLINR